MVTTENGLRIILSIDEEEHENDINRNYIKEREKMKIQFDEMVT